MHVKLLTAFLLVMSAVAPAQAEFLVSSAIIEFLPDGPQQQDIDLISRSQENDYLVTEVSEVLNAGLPNESRRLITDPSQGMLLVTPDKTILSAGGRKVMRFVLLRKPDDKEHIYRVAIKPVIKGVGGEHTVGLKILVGYEVLVIIRPTTPVVQYNASRSGRTFTVSNSGNTNVLFQGGQQCPQPDKCQLVPVARAYPGGSATVTLPLDLPVHFSVWDGKELTQKQYD